MKSGSSEAVKWRWRLSMVEKTLQSGPTTESSIISGLRAGRMFRVGHSILDIMSSKAPSSQYSTKPIIPGITWPPAHPGSRPVDGRVALRLISPCRSDDGSPETAALASVWAGWRCLAKSPVPVKGRCTLLHRESAYRLVLPVQLMDMQPNHFLQRIGSAARGQRNLLALNTMRPRRS